MAPSYFEGLLEERAHEPGNRAGDAFGVWSEVILPFSCGARGQIALFVYKNTGDASIACQALEGRATEDHTHIHRSRRIVLPVL